MIRIIALTEVVLIRLRKIRKVVRSRVIAKEMIESSLVALRVSIRKIHLHEMTTL